MWIFSKVDVDVMDLRHPSLYFYDDRDGAIVESINRVKTAIIGALQKTDAHINDLKLHYNNSDEKWNLQLFSALSRGEQDI